MSARVYMAHAGHFIGGASCRFVLNTYVPTGYIVSTVGEYCPSVVFDGPRGSLNRAMRPRRDNDPPEELGFSGDPERPALFETMVFRAVADDSKCCPWRQESGSELDGARYSTSDEAAEGHEAMCRKWEAPQ